MPIDPDHIRVDLLKMKRKLYISYPEGSKERQDFIYATKLSELKHLKTLVDPETVGMVFQEYKNRVGSEILNIFVGLGFGTCFSVMMFGFHQAHPANVLLTFYLVPLLAGVLWSFTHVLHLIDNWRAFKPFKLEYDTLCKKILKLLKELENFK